MRKGTKDRQTIQEENATHRKILQKKHKSANSFVSADSSKNCEKLKYRDIL